jgi:DNA processing protein
VPEELLYKIAISLLPGVGDKTAKKLIAYCGGANAVFAENNALLKKIPGYIPPFTQNDKKEALSRAETELRFIEKKKISPLYFLDEDYPIRLKHCEDAPIILYTKGNVNLSCPKTISIVGTRKATPYGMDFCEKFISELSGSDILIISGLAYGIDIAAHKAAVKYNLSTVASLAHGLDRIYPAAHKSVVDSMLENGGIISEFISGKKPDRENFPKRNRIIAGLADATIVVEAAISGGALITAGIASAYNRDVFAVPGRVGDEFSQGCNYLIKKNLAAIIESADDLLNYMGWNQEIKQPVQKQLFVELNAEEEVIVNLLKEHGTMPIDNLSIISKMNTSKLSSHLLNLEFSGVVKSLPGKLFQLL